MSGKQKVATVLNWLGKATYQLHDEFNYARADKDKLSDVLDRFEAHFRPQHNMIHAWYRIGSTFSDSNEIKTQYDFMYRLEDLTSQCEFTNADEVVKFLFLIHNKHSEVKQELLNMLQKTQCWANAWSMPITLKVTSNQSNYQDMWRRHSHLSVLLRSMYMQLTRGGLNLNDVMSHQQGEIVGAVMVIISPSVISVD